MTPKGIRVVRVSPGWIETEAAVWLADQAGTDDQGGKKIIMDSLGGILLGRPVRLQEVADLVVFLGRRVPQQSRAPSMLLTAGRCR